MQPKELFDILLPGDDRLGVPSFSMSDSEDNVIGFLKSLPNGFIDDIAHLTLTDSSLESHLDALKGVRLDLRQVMYSLLSFYFSRPAVVRPLTGRSIPLSTSGIAKF